MAIGRGLAIPVSAYGLLANVASVKSFPAFPDLEGGYMSGSGSTLNRNKPAAIDLYGIG